LKTNQKIYKIKKVSRQTRMNEWMNEWICYKQQAHTVLRPRHGS
jgi:hypothetical protein